VGVRLVFYTKIKVEYTLRAFENVVTKSLYGPNG